MSKTTVYILHARDYPKYENLVSKLLEIGYNADFALVWSYLLEKGVVRIEMGSPE